MAFLFAVLFTLQTNQVSLSWQQVSINEDLSVELPENHEIIDTLGQVIYVAESQYSIITLSSMPEFSLPDSESISLRSIEELKEFYDGLEKGTINSKKGKIISSNDILLDSLTARIFQADYPNGETMLNQVIVIQDHVYFASVRFATENLDYSKEEADRFFKSFQLNVKTKNQLKEVSTENSAAYNVGYFIGKYIGYLMIPILLICIIVFLKKARKKRAKA
ncbi:hypothetical protein [Roseivirga sp.]|uniref:hypothetical protein n=1 Tax=Roseivirga sp. TaxID=1964215 RepID=UPI003B8B57FF